MAHIAQMQCHSPETIAVIFNARRTDADEEGYRDAAERMVELAQQQDGFCGIDSVRDESGFGITVSYWRDEAAAKAWRDNADHTSIREAGRGKWYSEYSLHVAAVTRSYGWTAK